MFLTCKRRRRSSGGGRSFPRRTPPRPQWSPGSWSNESRRVAGSPEYRCIHPAARRSLPGPVHNHTLVGRVGEGVWKRERKAAEWQGGRVERGRDGTKGGKKGRQSQIRSYWWQIQQQRYSCISCNDGRTSHKDRYQVLSWLCCFLTQLNDPSLYFFVSLATPLVVRLRYLYINISVLLIWSYVSECQWHNLA